MAKTVECTAITVVFTERRYAPGETLHLAPDEAAELEALGAVEQVVVPVEERPVTDVRGVGPKVAARLAEAGVETVGALAALDAAALAAIAAERWPVAPQALGVFQDAARKLIEDASDGE